MPYTFTQAQITDLVNLRGDRNANDPNVTFADVYERILEYIEGDNDADVQTVVVFLRGAVQVNGRVGNFSQLIRAYTQRELELRGSQPIADQEMADTVQLASNAIASRIVNDIISGGTLPTITSIADFDASGAVLAFFEPNLDPQDTAATEVAAGWAGTPFFSHFGDWQLWRLLSAGDAESAPKNSYTMNRFDDLRNVLFALDSMSFGLRSQTVPEWIESWLDDPRVNAETFGSQLRTVLAVIATTRQQQSVSTARVYELAAGQILSAFANVGSPDLARLFAQMSVLGRGSVLDQIRGAFDGQIRSGTTDDTFLTAARSFFTGIDAAYLQSTGAEVASSRAAMVDGALAAGGERYRNALRGLSGFVIDLPSYTGRDVDLYDRVTGSGSITDRWIEARAAMLELRWLMDQNNAPYAELWRPTGALYAPVLADRIFTDLASGVSLGIDGVDFGIVDPIKVVFGTAANNAITGGSGRDEIFGEGGDDTVSGGDGDDYIEGGAGADQLDGGAKNDQLIGGAGDDSLTSGDGRDVLDGGAGSDTYRISATAQSTTLRDADGSGSIVIERSGEPSYVLGSGIHEVAGSPGYYRDNRGNRYRMAGANLIVQVEDGARTITIENFVAMSGSRLGIDLQGSQATNPTGAVYDVGAPDQPHAYPPVGTPAYFAEINAVGDYNAGGWNSPGSYFHRLDAEIINASAALGDQPSDVYSNFWVSAGMGDSYITGDDGRNTIRDDSQLYFIDDVDAYETWGVGSPTVRGIFPLASNFALGIWGPGYNMAPVMGNDVIHAGGGNDAIRTSGGDDTVYGGSGDDFIWDTHAGAEARPTQSYTYNGITAQGVTYIYGFDTEWVNQAGHSSNDRLFGEAGNDFIYAHGGNQLMDGGADNDQLVSGAGSDTLIGGSGNDVLGGDLYWNGIDFFSDMAEYGSDLLDGGAGADTLYGGGGNDSLLGGADDDTLYGDFIGTSLVPADPDSIHGDDHISGDAGNDVIYGSGGNDTLDGGIGNDTIHGGSDSDLIRGGAGVDTLYGDDASGAQAADEMHGGDQDDTLYGGGGTDTLYGDAGSDTLHGGSQADALEGGDDNDFLYGESGNDTLRGGAGHDELYGGEGNDRLEAGSGDDLLAGGAHNDTYTVGRGMGHVTIVDTEGSNTLWFAPDVALADINLRMSGGQVIVEFSPTDSVAMDMQTFRTLGPLALGNTSSETLSMDRLREQFTPEPIADGTLQLAAGVAVGDIFLTSQNDDLILVYSGAAPSWIDTSALAGSNIMFVETSGTVYGQPAGSRALVLTNWYRAAPGAYVDELLDAGAGSTNLTVAAASVTRRFVGTAADESLAGTDGADQLFGQAGSDVLAGGAGNDFLSGSSGDDLLLGDVGDDTYGIAAGTGQDVVVDADGASDFIVFGPGIATSDLTLTRRAEGLLIQIGPAAANDSVWISDQSSSGGQAQPIEYFQFADGTVWNSADIEAHLSNHAPVAGEIASQNARVDQEFAFAVPANTFTDVDPGDQLSYSASLAGGQALPSWLTFDPTTQAFSGTPPAGAIGTLEVRVTAVDLTGLLAASTFVLSIAPPANQGTSGDDTITGDESGNALDGLAGNDTLYGLGGDDALYGSQGNDWLEGGAGADEMSGGSGDDTYVVDDAGDLVQENAQEGTDHVRSSISYALGDSVENLTLTGTADLDATGNALANVLVGNSGSNTLDGGAGADSMQGGDGDDFYIVDDALDAITELSNAGVDSVQASVSHTLSGHVENLTLTGTAANGSGNGLDNILIGNAADNSLSGGAGNDTLEGGAGNDVLAGGSGNNTYIFGRGDGQDTISGFIDSTPTKLGTLSFRADVQPADIVVTRDSTSQLSLSIAGTSDRITISSFNITLSSPVQQVRFADGSVWSLSHLMEEGASTLSMATAMAITATGNSSNNTITGTSASNLIDGGAGTDALIGGAGDDTYIVDTTRTNFFWDQSPELWNFLDTVTEQAGEGYDTIIGHNVYSATLSAQAERLVIIGGLVNFNVSFTLAQDVRKKFTGNALDNVIDASQATSPVIGEGQIGSGGLDLGETVIDGGAGADIMIGPATRTRFVVDNVGDVVISNSAITRIDSFITYSLAPTYADLRLLGSASISGTGNALANVMDGSTNSAGNLLVGGGGNDTYFVGAGDTVVESAAEGVDSVTSNVSFTLGDNVENLTLIGNDPINGAGNALDNIITGTHAMNVLDGGAGNDQLIGAANHDRYTGFGGASGLDVIVESGVGFDTIEFATDSSSNVEQWQFSRIGNDLNMVVGPDSAIRVQNWYVSANNQVDQLWVYHDGLRYIYSASQLQARANGVNSGPVTNAGAAHQNTMASQAFSYQVAANAFADIESQHSLSYSATRDDGTPLPSWLTFDPATRTFSGTAASLDVGTFWVRLTATDAGSQSASTTFFISVNPLQLIGTPGNDTLTGDEGFNVLQGLGGDDTLVGLGGDDSLTGDEGNDTLDGGTGIDEMLGGLGDDVYYRDDSGDFIEEFANEGTDEIRSSINYTSTNPLIANVENLTLLAGATIGFGNSLDNVIVGNSGNNTLTGSGGHDTLDGGGGTDTLSGGAGNDTFITDGGDTLQESSGIDTVRSSAATFTLASGFENLVLIGSGNINGTGNSAANQITGNAGNNTLTGAGGSDTLTGGNGADIYSYSTGHGADTINNASTDSAQDRLNVTNLTSSQVTFSRAGDDLLMTRTSTPSDNVRVLGWFADTGNQLDFVQFTNQTLTAAQINALFPSGLMSATSAARDEPSQWLSRFVDAMNHFGDSRGARFAVVEDHYEAASAGSEWFGAPAIYEGSAMRSWGKTVGRALS